MQVDEYEDLVAQIKRVKMAKKPYYFWFCPIAKDDRLPILFVEKKQSPVKKRGREARPRAKVKTFAQGTVWMGPEGLVFCNELKLDKRKIEKLFKTKLAKATELKKIAPLLRKARILTVEEHEELQQQSDPTVVPTASAPDTSETPDLEPALMKKMKEAKKLFQKARDLLGNGHDAVAILRAHRQRVLDAIGNDDLAAALLRADELIEQGRETLEASLQQAWDEKLLVARDALTAAKQQLGDTGDAGPLETLRNKAVKARKSGNFAKGVELLDQLILACDEVQSPDDPEEEETYETDWETELEYRVDIARDLIGDWEVAQQLSRTELDKFKAAALNLPGVAADPRYPLIEEALGDFDPVPDLGDDLAQALDALTKAMNAGFWDHRAKAVMKLTKAHRSSLRGEPVLKNMDKMLTVRVRASLMDTLYDIEKTIKGVS